MRSGDPPKLDGRRLSRPTQSAIRRIAVDKVLAGARPSAVMRQFGLCRTSVYRWLRAVRAEGRPGIAARPHSGRPPSVAAADAARVRDWIVGHMPRELGLEGSMWTRRKVVELVERRLRVHLTLMSAGRLLRRVGLGATGVSEHLGDAVSGASAVFIATDRRGAFLCELVPDPHGSAEVRVAVQRLRRRAGRDVRIGFRPLGAA